MRSSNPNLGEVDFFVQLESKVWAALASGDASADEQLLAENFLGVYSTGFAGRQEHTDQLRFGPTVLTYALSEPRVTHLCQGLAVLSYLATWSRQAATAPVQLQERTYISSIWKQEDGNWRNVFSQDTKADAQPLD
jgi:hypothetical protein